MAGDNRSMATMNFNQNRINSSGKNYQNEINGDDF